MVYSLKRKIIDVPDNAYLLKRIESMRNEKDTGKKLRTLSFIIENLPTIKVVSLDAVTEEIENTERRIFEEIRKIGNKLDAVIVYVKPGLHEELILHIGAISSVGGVEYTLTIPLQGLSYSEVKEDLKEISGKRVNQISMLPTKIAKIVKEYLIENQMEDLLNKLC